MVRVGALLFPIIFVSGMACGNKLNPVIECQPAATTPTYGQDIKVFVGAYCGCHSTHVSNRLGAPTSINFDTYSDATTYAVAANEAVLGGGMPPKAPLDPNQSCVFSNWIAGGMQP